MPFADVEAKTTFTGFDDAEKTTILNAMKTAYDGSATAKGIFDGWIATAGNTIRIEELAGKFQAFTGTGRIQIDLAYLTDANYVDDDGQAVQDTVVTAVMHELVHAIEGDRDDGDYVTDYRGATVVKSNLIYKELGLPEQNSYVAYDSTGDILTRDREYTAGAEIDRSFAGNRDWNSTAAGTSKDLLIGGPGANTLQSGPGADVLFGAGGDDDLKGGAGSDVVLYTGKPTDYDLRANDDGTWTSRHVRGAADEGTDTITNIEKVRFTGDETFNLSKSGLTYQTDFAFVVDATGSMGDDIAAVKAAANGVLDALFADDSIDARVGVVTFRDNTIGQPTQVVLPFTDQDAFADRKAAATAAIGSLGASGGGDTPESAFDGLLKALDGSMGDWRVGAGTKRIALFTDAPAKDFDLLPTVVALALDIGAVISGRSAATLGPAGRTDVFELTYGPEADGIGGRDPGSEGDVLPDFTPTDETPTPLGGTTSVAITTIFVETFTTPDPSFEEVSTDTGGSVISAADPDEVVATLLALVETPNYQIVADADEIEEGDDGSVEVSFTISRDRTAEEATVTLERGGDADGADAADPPATVTLAAGEGTASFTVSFFGDRADEDDETFSVSIADISEPATIGRGEATVTILDDDDEIAGTRDADFLVGTPGADVIRGRAGDDDLRGWADADLLRGGRGDDDIRGGRGRDTAFGGVGDDDVSGAAGADRLRGGRGDDYVAGNKGDDEVRGGHGSDVVRGGAGDDTLFGGRGIDKVVGGDGADVFVLIKAAPGFDVIADFEAGIDSFEVRRSGRSDIDDLVLRKVGESTRVVLDGDLMAVIRGDDHDAVEASDFVFV